VADFWRVNSYGYPNPFVQGAHARGAWETLLSFFRFQSYEDLKRYWASSAAPRPLSRSGVESWKATFEEFGLLYVLTGDDEIRITNGGRQLMRAAEANDSHEFARIGLGLLLRYPLRGSRGTRTGSHATSDLLVYWAFYATLRELGNHLWWPEFERVLATSFSTGDATTAVDRIRRMREDPNRVSEYPPPVPDDRGGFYNSLNQVVVHAGMNWMLLDSSTDEAYYPGRARDRRIFIRPDWIPLIDVSLGGTQAACIEETAFPARMPAAPLFGSEAEYFEYAGAEVPIPPDTDLQEIVFHGGLTVLLRTDQYDVVDPAHIDGASNLCRVSRDQRVILAHDLQWSYIVEDKARVGVAGIRLRVRRGRPITDHAPLLPYLGEPNGGD
jgi:hypothetical protein